ncbi:hypothetical protein ACIPLC_35985 [Kitasatospora sp. NPDC086801]|uniref:hypothetical protein n=1 Tax=Kitasatospora sp. NPDC086801 TaxID=3364066 RepID=UPI0037F5D60D
MTLPRILSVPAVWLGDQVVGLVFYPYKTLVALAALGTQLVTHPQGYPLADHTAWVVLIGVFAAGDTVQWFIRRHQAEQADCDFVLDHAENCTGCWDYLYDVAHLPEAEQITEEVDR